MFQNFNNKIPHLNHYDFLMTLTFQSLNMIKKSKINSTMPIVMIFIVNTNFEM